MKTWEEFEVGKSYCHPTRTMDLRTGGINVLFIPPGESFTLLEPITEGDIHMTDSRTGQPSHSARYVYIKVDWKEHRGLILLLVGWLDPSSFKAL